MTIHATRRTKGCHQNQSAGCASIVAVHRGLHRTRVKTTTRKILEAWERLRREISDLLIFHKVSRTGLQGAVPRYNVRVDRLTRAFHR